MSEEFNKRINVELKVQENYPGKNYSGDYEEKWRTTGTIDVDVSMETAGKIFRTVAQLLSEEE